MGFRGVVLGSWESGFRGLRSVGLDFWGLGASFEVGVGCLDFGVYGLRFKAGVRGLDFGV